LKELKDIISIYHHLSDESFKEIDKLTEYREYVHGDCFIEKGKRNHHEYFIIEGICRSYLINPEGEEITISFFNPESVLSPFVTRTLNGISTLYYQALTDLKVGIIDATIFEELMVENQGIREFGNMVLKMELQKKIEKEIYLASLTAKERLIKFREQYRNLENLVPHSVIATFLGITNVSLSRLRRDLADR
jgi:CRP-like cAMP-binding protein